MSFLVERIVPGVQMIRARDGPRMANSYVLGDGDLIVVEPVVCLTEDDESWRRLFESWVKQCRTITVVVTHWHGDHALNVNVHALRHGVDLLGPAQPEAWRLLCPEAEIFPPRLGRWQVIHTPGHSAEHVCLWDGSVLVAGDMTSTDVVDELDFAESWARLRSLRPKLVLPGHGDPTMGFGP